MAILFRKQSGTRQFVILQMAIGFWLTLLDFVQTVGVVVGVMFSRVGGFVDSRW